MKTFLHFELKTKAIAIGERIKGGTFRPCIGMIPTSTLRGSLKDHFGVDSLAIGFFREGTYEKDIFVYAPFDAFLGTAKLPLSIEYLKPADGSNEVEADVYIVKDGSTCSLTNGSMEIALGALKSKGFGKCKFKYIKEIRPGIKTGYLKGRLIEEKHKDFGISRIIKRCCGYLFYPTSTVSGVYKRALFEGSIIEGPEILIEEEYKYDS